MAFLQLFYMAVLLRIRNVFTFKCMNSFFYYLKKRFYGGQK